MYQRGKTAKRKFHGLAGSPLATILDDNPELKPFVTNEKSITEIGRRAPLLNPTRKRRSKKLDIRISSADLDPALEPVRLDDDAFQAVAFDPRLGKGTNPKECLREFGEPSEETGDPEKDNTDGISTINEVCQALGVDGFVVQAMRGQKIRRNTPEWVKTLDLAPDKFKVLIIKGFFKARNRSNRSRPRVTWEPSTDRQVPPTQVKVQPGWTPAQCP